MASRIFHPSTLPTQIIQTHSPKLRQKWQNSARSVSSHTRDLRSPRRADTSQGSRGVSAGIHLALHHCWLHNRKHLSDYSLAFQYERHHSDAD
eukprot:764091-Hanusia_phi.AAC.3